MPWVIIKVHFVPYCVYLLSNCLLFSVKYRLFPNMISRQRSSGSCCILWGIPATTEGAVQKKKSLNHSWEEKECLFFGVIVVTWLLATVQNSIDRSFLTIKSNDLPIVFWMVQLNATVVPARSPVRFAKINDASDNRWWLGRRCVWIPWCYFYSHKRGCF